MFLGSTIFAFLLAAFYLLNTLEEISEGYTGEAKTI